MLQYAIIALTLIALPILWAWGDREEKTIAAAVALLLVLTPLSAELEIDGLRPGVAVLEILFLIGICALVFTRDRWWLTALAGFQSISVITHIIPLISPDHPVWSGVTVRLEVWVLICSTFFVGAWEAWAARRFARRGVSNDHVVSKGGSRLE